MKENSRDDWDQHWSNYTVAATSNPAQHFRFKRICHMINELTMYGTEPKLVDVGCGNGDFLHYLTQESPEVRCMGIEPSRSGSEIASRKLGEGKVRKLDLIKAGAEDTKDINADIVVCTEVLEHLDDPALLLSAIRTKIMLPGSRIVISVPGGPRSAYDRHIGHRRHFSRSRLYALIESTGFEEIRIQRSGFPFFNLYKTIVILMGRRLISSPEKYTGSGNGPSRLSIILMRMMEAGPRDNRFGWQLFASAVCR